MSLEGNDEFVVFPSQSNESNVMLGIRYSGSHAPGYRDVSGRQHRPTEPGHEPLRCDEIDDDLGDSRPGRERTLDVECTSTGRIVPPGIEVGKPGKLANTVLRVDQGSVPPAVTMPRAASALRIGEVSGRAAETSEATGDPPADSHFYSGARAAPLFSHIYKQSCYLFNCLAVFDYEVVLVQLPPHISTGDQETTRFRFIVISLSGYGSIVVNLALEIQQTGLHLENERKIDIFFPPLCLDSYQSACLEIDFTAFTYFEVKLAYATPANNAYKERLMFRSIESLGSEFRVWKTTITPNMTEGQEFVVVLHSKSSSLGTMATINSITLHMLACYATGKNANFVTSP